MKNTVRIKGVCQLPVKHCGTKGSLCPASVCPCVCLPDSHTFLVVTHRRHMHSSECCHYVHSKTHEETAKERDYLYKNRHTDRQTPYKVMPMCRYASHATQQPRSNSHLFGMGGWVCLCNITP